MLTYVPTLILIYLGTMSGEEVRRVSREDIQLVQNLIEQCLQLHMSQKEVMHTLLVKAKIEPGFTELVWQKLEEENPEFFKAYHLRLLVKDQIVQFNMLLEKQAELMRQLSIGTPIHMSNGPHIPLRNQNSACYVQEYTRPTLQAGDMQQPLCSSSYSNGGSSSMHMQGTVDISNDAKRNNISSNMLMTQSSNMGLVQGMNGQKMKSDTGYINGSPCMFGPNGNVLDARHAAGEIQIPVSSYSSVESHPQPINNNNTLLGADAAYESLGQIPRNFSLSDLTADFSLDILENYSGSPFLAASSDSFLNPQLQDNRRLDTISEGLSYDNFGSDRLK
ncbi:uncharacterized protein LOC124933476 isoform X2 [Impatiens glandulifera]|uniref:uncharacterized protein LOC124933476 isoform X2 n=1 Tax=Impatiens glandulifera TaxID=253017 RepID=UPI001FB19CA5|nr:uncharacterized protein LOC124933476 isoform X2 [Impatiens glandulifera]